VGGEGKGNGGEGKGEEEVKEMSEGRRMGGRGAPYFFLDWHLCM